MSNPHPYADAYARALRNTSRPVHRVVLRVQRELNRRPLLAKTIPTSFGFAFGDFLTQFMNRDRSKPYRHNFTSTAAMAGVGAVIGGPLGLAFVRWMEYHIMPGTQHPAARLTRFTMDQVLGCVLWQFAYLSLHEHYRRGAQQNLQVVSDSTEFLIRRLTPHPC